MPALPIDQATAVRPGEELALDRLQRYLRDQLSELAGPLGIRQFPRGFSNLTYLVEERTHEGPRRQWVLRRPPFGSKVATAHDMGREHRILSGLAGVFDKAPKPVLFCDDPAVLGAPFYLMERVEGTILRGQMAAEQAPGATEMAQIADAFVQTLAELHAVDFRACGLGDLGKPEGYVRRQVEGWTKRYGASRTDDLPAMERAATWLSEHLPEDRGEAGAALIHNDFKYDNLVLAAKETGAAPGQDDRRQTFSVRAVLDWEMATLGDPRMDVGTALGYWAQPDDPPEILAAALSPTTLPGNPGRAELAERYAAASGRELGNLVFFYAFGLFKIAVIVQQIFYRYRSGHTQDPRFASLGAVVRACGRMAAQAIDRRRLDRLFE